MRLASQTFPETENIFLTCPAEGLGLSRLPRRIAVAYLRGEKVELIGNNRNSSELIGILRSFSEFIGIYRNPHFFAAGYCLLKYLIMKHYPHDLSDVVIHPLYKTQLFEFILRLLFVLLYPAASFSLCKKYSTAISNILAGNLDTYQSYLHCCASLVVSRSFSSTTPLLFTALKMRNKEPLGYAASNALAEAMFNMLEDGSHKNFKYWYSWFEERNASFEQWIFLRFVMMILIDD